MIKKIFISSGLFLSGVIIFTFNAQRTELANSFQFVIEAIFVLLSYLCIIPKLIGIITSGYIISYLSII
jgi:hypothetical protein